MLNKLLSCILLACLACCFVSFTTPQQVNAGDYLVFKVMDVHRVAKDQRYDTLHAVAKIKNTSTQAVEFGMKKETRMKQKVAFGFAYTRGEAGNSTSGLPVARMRLEPQESLFVPWSMLISKKTPTADIDAFTYTFNYLCVGETVLSDDKCLRLRAPEWQEGISISSMDSILEKKFLFNKDISLVQQEGKDFLRVHALSGHSARVITSLQLKKDGDALQLIATTRPSIFAPKDARGDLNCIIALPAEVKRLVLGLNKEPLWQP